MIFEGLYFRLFCTFYYGQPSHPGEVEIFLVASNSILNRTVSHHFLSQQRRRTPLWTKIMKINSFFGTEDFYIPMGVFILW